jgi:D-glycero-D-manno-heptose 1,7-bisphosphate phosphatase
MSLPSFEARLGRAATAIKCAAHYRQQHIEKQRTSVTVSPVQDSLEYLTSSSHVANMTWSEFTLVRNSMATRNIRPAAFLDRDGVINRKAPEGDYIKSPRELELLPGVAEAIAQLNRSGWPVVVITNQRGVARGLMTGADVDEVHQALQTRLGEVGASIEGFFVCPHHRDSCDCRKPKPGLLLRAAEELGLELGRSWMIGDRESDVQAGLAAGCRTIRLEGNAPPDSAAGGAHHHALDLHEAVTWLLEQGAADR